ncbi:PREDICTED: pyrroline-5-carboxylate reductase 3 isoform X1 [Nanorana parkeri]|uniref:pyrroline-5-carboxylate reductase 3 isoform X1 n=1 Tax=Nanorana parkeri TaxID=125878 RepID=UPI000854EEEC|nr:PREDICTED: pyrroline-5-carboxylate reductase 3 isoform X1 [Nanorana parkeri]
MAEATGEEIAVGCIGAGKMARGVLGGLLITGKVPAKNLTVSAPTDTNLQYFRDRGCSATHSNAAVVSKCRVIFLATKPHIIPAVLQEVSSAFTPDHVIISMAAGVSLQTLEKRPPVTLMTRFLRMSPNLPLVIQEGAVVYARGSCAGQKEADLLKSLLSDCGMCEETPESYIDIHTGLSGSGVAYVYLFAEALADGAVKMGMPSALASRIAAQTLLGAAKMIIQSGEHPAKLRSDVCTPGGTTIHGLHELEKGALRATVINAVEAATKRARDLDKR